ncbi:MAG: dienelactone hydrolase family protein [Acidobacteria bacterium]|nr:dienelactone hydrolase family protein [Acidobacteriota bacterium]
MITRLFHHWERRLAARTVDRVVRPFEWGVDWVPEADPALPPDASLAAWAAAAMTDTDRFYALPRSADFRFDGRQLTFPSALETPHPENNTVHARYFPADAAAGARRRAVVVLPQWNAGPEDHMALARLLARFGISALRLSLPYHDARMPPELRRADYIVSANVGRTAQICRQAVLDARRAVDWLESVGYERIGILGTSLGSCLAMLAAAHDERLTAAALNHISIYFADVVWEGLSTAHVRAGLGGSIDLERLRALWMPISPAPYVTRMRGTRTLLVYARYDLSFPVRLSRQLVDEFRRAGLDPEVCVLPCGHYSTGIAPFNWLDGYRLIEFLRRAL